MNSGKTHQQQVAARFGKRIRKLREGKEISLRRFAISVGMSPTYLSKIERGEFSPPSEFKVRGMARILEQDEDELLALAGRISEDVVQIIVNKNQLASVLRAMKDMSEEEITQILANATSGRGSEER